MIKADPAEILLWLMILLLPDSVAELRCLKTEKGTISGYYDDFKKMAAEAADLSGKVAAVYCTLNPVLPDLLARSVNQIKPYARNTTADEDIIILRWLPLDFDPVRPAGISSSEPEHEAALARARKCSTFLSDQGWAKPILADSGNGGHLLYRIELPNDQISTDLIGKILKILNQKFSDSLVLVDTSVGNAGRIWKIYGTLSAKGDSTPDRPHRFARLLNVPEEIGCVTREQLQKVAAMISEPQSLTQVNPGDIGKTLDVVAWLERHGLALESQSPWKGAQKFILAQCPLNPEHARSAYIVQFANGALSAGCQHKSCVDLDWRKLRDIFEPRPIAPPYSDDAVALEFTKSHGDNLKYAASMSRWFCWTGTHYRNDEMLRVFTEARNACRAVANNAFVADPSKARRLASSATVSAVEKLARFDPRHAVKAEQWDSDPWALNTPTGTVDLRTGISREHNRKDYITKIAPVCPGGDCPLWLEFLARITGRDRQLELFLQRSVGYSLTGSTREHALFFLYGTGTNGKTVFMSAVMNVLGPYARTTPVEMLMATRNASERHPCDMAALAGARLVAANEVERGGRWAESKLKALTGGDTITARFMHGNFFEYVPQFKLFVVGNHRPSLRSVDEAIRRRFYLVPFSVTIPPSERDPDLVEKLKAEYSGILAWAIEGCLAWQRDGLNPPAIVRDETNNYFGDEDALGRWIAERCILDPSETTSSTALFASWSAWTESVGEFTGSKKAFAQQLGARNGITNSRTSRERVYRGIRLRNSTDEFTPSDRSANDGGEMENYQ